MSDFDTIRTAQEFNISGFVRNEPDGTVYIEGEGEQDSMEAFLEWCRRGPKWARVDRFDFQEQPFMNYEGFDIH